MYAALYECVARRCMTDLSYSPLIFSGMSSPEMERRGRRGQRKIENRDERKEGITAADSEVDYLLCCGACPI